ncbi:MAG: CBS domain-containing protein [Actinomycetota bacterium]
MKIADVVTQEAVSIRQTTRLGAGFRTPQGVPIVVTDDIGRPVGIIRGEAPPNGSGRIPPGAWHPSMLGAPSSGIPAAELMRARPPVVSEEATLAEAAALFLGEGVSDVIVCDRFGRAIGLVARAELAANRERRPRHAHKPLRHGDRAQGGGKP